MPSLSSRVQVTISGVLTGTLDLQDLTSPIAFVRSNELTNGAGANQANVLFSDTRTLAPSATDALDLVGGGLVDAFGVAVAPARLRAVCIVSSPANLNNLTILGNAAAIPILGTPATVATLTPGGIFLITKPDSAGIVVTPTTFDILQIVNAAGVNSVTYDVVLLGCAT